LDDNAAAEPDRPAPPRVRYWRTWLRPGRARQDTGPHPDGASLAS